MLWLAGAITPSASFAGRPPAHRVAPARAVQRAPAPAMRGEQAFSFGPAAALRTAKRKLPQVEWLAAGEGSAENKVDMPDHVARILSQPHAPQREAEGRVSCRRTPRITRMYTLGSLSVSD